MIKSGYKKFKPHLLLHNKKNPKCFIPTPSGGSGPDKVCSDGKCYLAKYSCPTNTTQLSSTSCMCSTDCTGPTSSLGVENWEN